jgi:hypothetical protein
MARGKKQDDSVFKDNYEAVMVSLSAFPPEVEDQKKLIFNQIEEAERDIESVKEEEKLLWKSIQSQYKLKRWEYNLALKFMRMKSSAERVGAWARIFHIMKIHGYEIPYDVLADAKAGEGFGQPIEGMDDSPVFDNTPAGSKAAGPVHTQPPATPAEPIRVAEPVPSSALDLQDAQRQFEENAHKAPAHNYAPTEEEVEAKNREIAAQRERDAAAFVSDEGVDRSAGEGEGVGEVDESGVTNVVQMKRRGGRPKGSKNKPKAGSPEAVAEGYVAEQEQRLGPVPSAPEIAPAPPEAVTEVSPFDDDDAEVPDWLKKPSISSATGGGLKGASSWRNTLETSTG